MISTFLNDSSTVDIVILQLLLLLVLVLLIKHSVLLVLRLAVEEEMLEAGRLNDDTIVIVINRNQLLSTHVIEEWFESMVHHRDLLANVALRLLVAAEDLRGV